LESLRGLELCCDIPECGNHFQAIHYKKMLLRRLPLGGKTKSSIEELAPACGSLVLNQLMEVGG
jgi:hypothetical protein